MVISFYFYSGLFSKYFFLFKDSEISIMESLFELGALGFISPKNKIISFKDEYYGNIDYDHFLKEVLNVN